MIKGICQSYFSQDTPLETVFQKSKEAGFDAVELALNKPGMKGITLETTVAEAREIKQLADDNGIQLRSFLFAGATFGSADAAVREQGNENLRKQFEICQALEVDKILIVPGRVDANHAYDEVYERSQQELSKFIPELEASGLYLAIENVWNNFLLSPLEFARYLDEFETPHIGAYFDVGNVLKIGFPEQWIRILGERIIKVHLKDFNVKVGTIQGFVPLLSGDVDWTRVMEELRKIEYNDALTAELTPYGHHSDQALRDIARHIDVIVSGEVK